MATPTTTPTPTAAATATGERTQRVHWFAGRLHAVLDDLVGTEGDQPLALGVLGHEETVETLTELDRAIARLTGLRASVLAHADALQVGLAATPLATSTSAWLRAVTTTPGPVASRTVKDALALEDRHHPTGAALRAGRIDADQAHVILQALDTLPGDLEPDLRTEAEAHLLHLATTHPADELRRLAKHLHEVVDPDAAEALLARRLAAEEAEADQKTSLWMRSDGHGTVRGGFTLPQLHGDLLTAMLDRFANPTRPGHSPHTTAPDRPEPRDQAWGRAMCELLESVPADLLPSQGGTAVAVVVTIPHQTLTGGLAAAHLDTDHELSPGEARRLAARHGIIPAVLGTGSVVLDLGVKARLFSASQRIALRVRHRTCTAEGCRIPAAWCQAHHKQPWQPRTPGQQRGPTDLANGTLLCGRHHRLVDRPGYHTTYQPDGTTVITRIRR